MSAVHPTCPQCKRELRRWPLRRGSVCSPKDWAYCIREWWT